MQPKHYITAHWAFIVLSMTALLFAAGALRAQIATGAADVLDAGEAIQDMAFFSAGDLTVTVKSTDDVFAAGGDVSIRDAQADHMIVAGGDVSVVEVAFHDLIAAGGDLNFVSGVVTDDLVAAGGDLSVEPQFKINGSAMLSGGEVTVDSAIGAELRAAAARLRLNANVKGDAHLIGEDVEIGPNVVIGGDLRYRARQFNMDPSVMVTGEIIELEPATPPDVERWGVQAAAALAAFAFAFVIGMAVLVIVIALALPGLMNSAADMIRTKPLKTLGLGFIVIAAAPVVIAILFATVLGIPTALLIGAIYLAAAPLAIAAFIYYVGMMARGIVSNPVDVPPSAAARGAWSALAAILLVLVGLIPIAGGFFWLIAYTIGMGAIMTRGGKALAFSQAPA